ncbi:MAG: DUF4058 family protein, partial [Planctomycetes bacterium]|nr:DUF4058 family protein [Planctomycetota bacterium]
MERGQFPGMHHYLEAHWRDIHSRLIIYADDQLQPQLPRDLRARVEERVHGDSPMVDSRVVYPDVRVVETARPPRGGAAMTGTATTSEPLALDVADEPMPETCLDIVEVGSGHRVVTALEILSAANKDPGEGQVAYLRKQRGMVQGRVNLVEVDLLRAGRRVLKVQPERIPVSHRTSYHVCVWRAERPTKVKLCSAPLRAPLPVVRVPLRPTDPDATLDLQALVGLCWRIGGYD